MNYKLIISLIITIVLGLNNLVYAQDDGEEEPTNLLLNQVIGETKSLKSILSKTQDTKSIAIQVNKLVKLNSDLSSRIRNDSKLKNNYELNSNLTKLNQSIRQLSEAVAAGNTKEAFSSINNSNLHAINTQMNFSQGVKAMSEP